MCEVKEPCLIDGSFERGLLEEPDAEADTDAEAGVEPLMVEVLSKDGEMMSSYSDCGGAP